MLHDTARQFLYILLATFLLSISVHGQTATIINGNGQTVIQVTTTDAAGAPLTTIIQTLATSTGTTATPATTANTPATATTLSTTLSTATTATPATVTALDTPPPQQGPVGQPAPTVTLPNGVTPFVYTTIIDGVTREVSDNFTPTNPATIKPTVGASGTVLDYSSWLAIYGPQTTTGTTNAGFKPSTSTVGWSAISSCLIGILGGVWLTVL